MADGYGPHASHAPHLGAGGGHRCALRRHWGRGGRRGSGNSGGSYKACRISSRIS
jgi:hypothetical protein